MTRGPRYTDSKDFDEIHDEITTWVMDNYSIINATLIRKENANRYNDLVGKYPIFRGEIEAISENIEIEKQFDMLYPDVIITGSVGIFHADNFVAEVHNKLPDKITFSLKCPACGVIHRETTISRDYYHQFAKETTIKDEQSYCEAISQLLGWEDIEFRIEDGNVVSDKVWGRNYCYKFDFLNIIEIKSYIKSFGETMRQLQSYRELLRRWKSKEEWRFGLVALITPDTRFNEYFEKQGFTVFTYKRDLGTRSLEYSSDDQKFPIKLIETEYGQAPNEKGGAGND